MVEVIVLSFALCGTTTAFLITLAKLQEEKERRWDEISRAAGLENEIEYMKQLYWSAEDSLTRECGLNLHLLEKNYDLQDKLSSVLCPTNNHVWKDGFCVKCGRVKE